MFDRSTAVKKEKKTDILELLQMYYELAIFILPYIIVMYSVFTIIYNVSHDKLTMNQNFRM